MPKQQKVQTDEKNDKGTKLSRLPKRITGFRTRRPKSEQPQKKLSSAFRIFSDSISLLRQHWKTFGGILLVLMLLNLILVGGLNSGYDFKELMNILSEEFGELSAGIALFSIMIGSTGAAASESGAVYQAIVTLIISLATIWALRQIFAGNQLQVRDAFYKGMYPLVPFVLVLLFLCLLLIPALLASFLFSTVLNSVLTVSLVEQFLWGLGIFLLLAWSVYLLLTFGFAAYVVALPDMRPMMAIKAARKLVKYQRWAVLRKVLFLPFAYLIIAAIILLPLLMALPGAVQVAFFVLTSAALIFSHTYLYSLYKEML